MIRLRSTGGQRYSARDDANYPSADLASMVTGQIAPNAATMPLHVPSAPNNTADPRRVPPPPSQASDQPAARRKFRTSSRTPGDRVVEQEDWQLVEAPNAYGPPTAQSGGLTGAPEAERLDAQVHFSLGGPAPAGPGPQQLSGGYDAARPNPVDWRTADTSNPNLTEPRKYRVGTGAPVAAEELGSYAVIDQYLVSQDTSPAAIIPDQKPQAWFLLGRPTRRHLQFFLRPFDQQWSDRFTGRKVLIGAPPTFTNLKTTGNRASFPIRTTVDEDTVTGVATPSTRYGAPGMTQQNATQRNSFRAMPQPWDTYLVNWGQAPGQSEPGTAPQ